MGIVTVTGVSDLVETRNSAHVASWSNNILVSFDSSF
jgi:hypothetical protein